MKTKFFYSFVALFVASVSIFAQTPDGLTCETAIPVDKSFVGTVPAAGTYYYSASTYDLPLTCYFYPDTPVEQAPKVYVDFTCNSGVYDDPNIVELLEVGTGWGIALPLILTFTDEYDKANNNYKYYSLSIGAFYRELMAQYNITYNVQAIVKLEAPCGGRVTLTPDTAFKSCVENSAWLSLPSSVATQANFASDSYVLPFADWKNDSIQFRWTGVNTPASLWIGKTCDFKLTTTGDSAAIAHIVLQPNAGNNEHIYSMTKQEVKDFTSQYGLGGVYYIKVVAAEDAEVVFEKKPLSPEMQKAIPLQLNQTVSVAANATDQVYYFPIEWENNSMYWSFATMANVTAYFSNNVTFEASSDDPSVFATYQVPLVGTERVLKLSKNQMSSICSNANGDHVFVKFITKQPTIFIPSLWSAGYCAEKTNELYLNQMASLQRSATSTAWRVNIEEWAQQDVKLFWRGSSAIKMYLADTCAGFTLSAGNQHVKYYREVKVATNGSRDTLTITKTELENLVQYADADGYLYFRFNNRNTGNLEVLADVVEPVIPTSPCVANSIELKANDQLTLNLDSAFTIYRINYNECVTTGATLTWNGTEPLHTFVAETCEFAVAPYNKYVHAYVTVPAEGVAVIDAAKLAEMAAYVDEDGYLYIRFLTEKEGVLEVK